MKKVYFFLSVIALGILSLVSVSCEPEGPAVSGIEITNPSPLTMALGTTDTLKVNVLPAETLNKEFEVLVADPSIVSVSETNVITALAEGTTTITAKTIEGGMEASIQVIVTPAPVTFQFDITEEPDADSLYYAFVVPSDLNRQYGILGVNEYTLHAYSENGESIEDWMEAYVKDILDNLNEEAGGMLTPSELAALYMTEYGYTGVCRDYALEPTLGKNYIFAFTLSEKTNVYDISYVMYAEIVPEGDVEVKLELVSAKARDLVISVKFPSNWIRNPYYPDENHPVVFCWGKKSEIGSMTDEQLVARDSERLLAEAAEADTTIAYVISKYQIYWRDYPASDPLFLAGLESLYAADGFEPTTEYVVYAYAMQYDYSTNETFAATRIARLEASTIEQTMLNIAFEFGIDRVVPGTNGDLTAYFGVDADDAYQRFTFCTINEADLAKYSEEGKVPSIDEVSEVIFQEHIDNYHSQWYTQPLENWTYIDYGYSSGTNGVKIDQNASKNKWYVLAGALDESLNIASEIKYKLMDVSGLTSTEAVIDMTVDGADGSYTYTVSSDKTPFIVTAVKIAEMEKWLNDNEIYDTKVETYVTAKLKEDLKKTTVAEYLAANGATSTVNKSITVDEDSYLIAYTIYEKSGLPNGLQYETLKAGAAAATEVTLTEEDGVIIESMSSSSFWWKWDNGRIEFYNGDNTDHIVLNQVYSGSDKVYVVDLDYAYIGNPNASYDSSNVFATEASIIFTKNADGTYTAKADMIFEDDTHYIYTYTGDIDSSIFGE